MPSNDLPHSLKKNDQSDILQIIEGNNEKYTEKSSKRTQGEPLKELIIRDKKIINLFNHDKKMEILKRLYADNKTIMMLSEETGWNPGTIKRHLIDLEQGGLIMASKSEINKFKVNMVYYRVTALKFIILWEWPTDLNL